ncbi:M12 family metallopeptidase [Massilia sp. ST3]|uniref:M12 family metallopeptidase n=1 Tax=Massilia sp. ST3 TaxID=2824903 RepID=UPI001B826E1B|nr:M12 family metallopeptidase [Massilia sp. ST3]MBQ5949030.1 hypothetical protein [Massilia sp. ST3]
MAATREAGEAAWTEGEGRQFCSLHPVPRRIFPAGVTPMRERLINLFGNKWVTGTVLHYTFFDRDTDGENVVLDNGQTAFVPWRGSEGEKQVVRSAFEVWAQQGIGVRFEEVSEREEAEIRIGFMRGDGAWSWLGREILDHASPNERTMNFGWNIAAPGELDTAIHEIGHTLGFPHEHQNPKAGIEWDEEAVYQDLARPPNEWDRDKTWWNIIRKLDPGEVEGTTWDADSVMHYPFKRGLIRKPEAFFVNGLQPAGGLSEKDRNWVRTLYPPTDDASAPLLRPAQSVLVELAPGQQRDFRVAPQETRFYDFRTFGASDSVMVLFENDNGQLRYRTGDDDSGEDLNASFRIKLFKGRQYVLRIRMYHSDRRDQTAVMMW